jgi:hypothetical protein
MDFEYTIAEELDRAWLNFELDLPLEMEPDGGPNPFSLLCRRLHKDSIIRQAMEKRTQIAC